MSDRIERDETDSALAVYAYFTSSWLFNPAHFAARLGDEPYAGRLEGCSPHWTQFIKEWIPQHYPGYRFPKIVLKLQMRKVYHPRMITTYKLGISAPELPFARKFLPCSPTSQWSTVPSELSMSRRLRSRGSGVSSQRLSPLVSTAGDTTFRSRRSSSSSQCLRLAHHSSSRLRQASSLRLSRLRIRSSILTPASRCQPRLRERHPLPPSPGTSPPISNHSPAHLRSSTHPVHHQPRCPPKPDSSASTAGPTSPL